MYLHQRMTTEVLDMLLIGNTLCGSMVIWVRAIVKSYLHVVFGKSESFTHPQMDSIQVTKTECIIYNVTTGMYCTELYSMYNSQNLDMCSFTSWEVDGAVNAAIVGETFFGSCS